MWIYKNIIRPLFHKIKRFRNFIRDLAVCVWRGWDLRLLTSCDMKIYKLPRSTKMMHPVGIVISSKAVIGDNCIIRQNVTIGRKVGGQGAPIIGDNVNIAAGAIIAGNITIGDNAFIGAGAIVLKDVPANTTYVSKFQPCYLPHIARSIHKMKILVITRNPSRASFRQRIGIYLARLADNKIEYVLEKLPSGIFARARLYKTSRHYDGVFIHKKRLNWFDSWMLRKYARKIIYDFDDAIMYDDAAPAISGRKRLRDFRRTVRMADTVIAGNAYLAEHASRFSENVIILPTGLKVDDYNPAQLSRIDDGKIRLVWIGSRSTLGYLQGISEALEEIGRRFENVELRIICDRFFDLENIKIEKIEWTLGGQYQALASCDIGLAPLPDDSFTRGKCGFKILQYAAAGLCVVSSPVGVNADFIEQGGYGCLASSIPDWTEKISMLVRDKTMRKEFGEAAMKNVREFDIDVIGKRLIEIVTQAIK